MANQRFRLEDYIPVQERVNQFWVDHPEGNIVTLLMSDPHDFELCRYRAEVYRHAEDARPAAVGHAFERAGQGMANQTSHEENCETSAIGRALANLGYATSHKTRPSREEMVKVEAGSVVVEKGVEAVDKIDKRGIASLQAKAKQRQVREDDLRSLVRVRYGVGTVEELSTEQGRHMYRWLNGADQNEIVDMVVEAVEAGGGGAGHA